MTAIALIGLASLKASADGLRPVQVPNGHGQSTALYRPVDEQSIALFVHGWDLRAKVEGGPIMGVSHSNGHGRTYVHLREER